MKNLRVNLYDALYDELETALNWRTNITFSEDLNRSFYYSLDTRFSNHLSTSLFTALSINQPTNLPF